MQKSENLSIFILSNIPC